MNRRKFIRNTSLVAVGSSMLMNKAASSSLKKESLVVAFLSDIYVKRAEAAEAGMRKAFLHVNSLKEKPDFYN